MMAIGFNSSVDVCPERKTDALHFLDFDSGAFLTHDDLSHNMIVYGITGSGKSADVHDPLLERFIMSGKCGLVIDVKGDVAEKALIFAKLHGRETDIEIMSFDNRCRSYNLLKNMKSQDLMDSLQRECCREFGSGDHTIWNYKGILMLVECYKILKELCRINSDPILCPTYFSLFDAITDWVSMRRLYMKLYRSQAAGDRRNEKLVDQLRINPFHIIIHDKDGNPVDRESLMGSASSMKLNDYSAQVTWNLQGVRTLLSSIIGRRGFVRNFCVPDAPAVNVGRMLNRGKIIIANFPLHDGKAGRWLRNFLKSEFYKAILDNKVKKPSFILMDEYQECATLDGSEYSDGAFASTCRSRNSSMVMLTQSMSGIYSRGASRADVDSLRANCNQQIFFYSDDGETQKICDNLGAPKPLNSLSAGECYRTIYNSDNRSHLCGYDSLNGEYRRIMDIVEQSPRIKFAEYPKNNLCPSLFDLLEMVDWKDLSESAAAVKPTEQNKDLSAVSKQNMSLNNKEKEERSIQQVEDEYGKKIRKLFPGVFADDIVLEFIPDGWRPYFEKVLAFAVNQCAASPKIDKISYVYSDFGMRMRVEPRRLIDYLLKKLENVCMKCGKEGEGVVCEDCLELSGENKSLSTTETMQCSNGSAIA